MSYEQAIARRNELRGIDPAAYAPARAGGTAAAGITSGQAALFQQQLTAATLTSMADADSGAAASGSAATTDPYASLTGGGLSTQAAMLSQLQGGAGAATSTGSGLSIEQLQTLLTQAQAQQGTTVASAAPAGVALEHVTGKTAKLDPELLGRLEQLGAELGKQIDIISGNRTTAEQAKLYAAYQNGTGNLAAPPGQSNHEHGDAADAYVDGVALANVPGARDAAARLGLHFPVGGEAWHVERTDG